jgi:hypothetical protein
MGIIMGCCWAIAPHGLHICGPAAAIGIACGITYCGIICEATGGHVGQAGAQGGGHVAATGVA